MKRKAKSVLTVLLAALMIMTMLPTTAFAASSKKTPAKVNVTKVTASTNAVTVSWKKASNATSYRIYYKQSTSKKWIAVANVSSSKTSYTHKNNTKTPLVGGKKYNYKVRAYNKSSKKWGSYSATKTVTIPAVPSTVKMAKVERIANNKVNISWNKAGNATSYRVYYKKSGASKWTAIANVSSSKTSYTHTSSKKYPLVSGSKYFYTVRAYNKNSKKWGGYNTKGISVTIPKKNTTTKVLVQSVQIDSLTTAIKTKGGTYQFTSKVLPTNATNKTLKWTSSNTKVATVDQNGKVTGISEGTVTITAEATDGSGKKDTASISVNFNLDRPDVPATGIKISKTNVELSNYSERVPISATLTPSNTTDWVEWESSNTKVVSVYNDEEIMAVGPGTATITAYVANNPSIKATCTVTVDYIQSVSLGNLSMRDGGQIVELTSKGATYQLSATIKPANTKHNALSWSSSDTSVATVDQNGKITAVGNGCAMIYCKAADTKQPNNPDLTDYCQVDVKIPEATATPTPSQASNVETVNLAGGESKILSVWNEDYAENIDVSKVTFEYQNDDIFGILGQKVSSGLWSRITIEAHRQGSVVVLAKYNGQTLKRWNVNVTSNWSDYVGYVNWRKNVESQIWNSNMSIVQKLDAAKDYIKTNFKYGTETQPDGYKSYAAVYAWQEGYHFIECTSASELFGDFAKDLNVRVGYVNSYTGKIYDYLVYAVSVSDGHVFNAVWLNDNWVYYDAQPPRIN